jgi:hypothetical protein
MSQTVEALHQWLTENYLDCLVHQYILDVLAIRELDTEDPHIAEKEIGVHGTMGTAAEDLPGECCLVLTLRTDVATRAARGRMFIPSPRASNALDGVNAWDTTSDYWQNVQQFAGQLISPWTFAYGSIDEWDATLTAEVWSRTHNVGHDVTSYVRRPSPHWLRSRSTAP